MMVNSALKHCYVPAIAIRFCHVNAYFNIKIWAINYINFMQGNIFVWLSISGVCTGYEGPQIQNGY